MPQRHLQYDELNAYLDGELGPDEAAEIEALLDAYPEDRVRLRSLADDKAVLARALEALDPPVENLRTAQLERKLAQTVARGKTAEARPRSFAFGRGAMQVAAACAFVAFGWWGHSAFDTTTAGVPEYVSEAVGAHGVFAEDTDRPVEFAAATVNTASDWFSQKLGVQVSAPDLSNRGIQLVGARLLGTKEGPLVQYVYEDGKGGRYSLTLAKHPSNTPKYATKFVDYPDSTVGYWSKGNIDYALVAKSSPDTVQSIVRDFERDI